MNEFPKERLFWNNMSDGLRSMHEQENNMRSQCIAVHNRIVEELKEVVDIAKQALSKEVTHD